MNETQRCLPREQLRQLVDCELSGTELAIAEAHLSTCPTCRAALDETMAQSDRSKGTGELPHRDQESVTQRSEGPSRSQYLGVLSLLGKSEDPEHLGRLANYEIVGILGQGGMGVVLKGFDAALNRHVAIKMLLPHLSASAVSRKQFAREAQAAAAVVDDHVIAIHSVAEWQGIPYLVMPYVQGMSLRERLKGGTPLELRDILRIGAQTAKGLAAAHKQGLVHRDVKPANILLPDGTQRIALTDFGLARQVDDESMTRTDAIVGTPRYMSPEQARGKPADFHSDLFSLGSVLYAMCTGQAPFQAETNYGVLRRITDEEPRPIAEMNAKIPNWLCRLIDKLMDKQPERRFGSAQEVAELLERCLAHVENPSTVPLPPSLKARSRVHNPEEPVAKHPLGIVPMSVAGAAIFLFGLVVIANLFDFSWNGASPAAREGAKPEIRTTEPRLAKAAHFANTTLQGTWQMVKGVNAESVVADETYMRTVTFVIHGDMFEMRNAADPNSTLKTRFTIDAEQFPMEEDGTPKRIKFIDYKTPEADGTMHPIVGLCDADATTLKICWGPKVLEQLAPAPGVIYAELRRVDSK